MIGKICTRGTDVRPLLGYLFREGLAGEHRLTAPHSSPRLIAAWDGTDGLEPPRTDSGGRDMRVLAAALNAPLLAAGLHRADWSNARPVYHLAISAAEQTGTADLFEQAARPVHRRTPQPTAAGHRIRGAAGALLALRRTLPSETRQVLALLGQLQSLAAAVARIRKAQGQAAQAAAALAAAEQLAGTVRQPTHRTSAATAVGLRPDLPRAATPQARCTGHQPAVASGRASGSASRNTRTSANG